MKSDSAAETSSSEDLPAEGTWVQSHDDRARSRELSTRREQPPAFVAGYQIQRCLGEGAYGSVWLATELSTGKAVAIKFYTQRRGLDWSLLNREVEKLAVLYTCHNIVGLISVGWNADPPHYVMEYLENGSLAGSLTKGPLPVKEAVRIGRDILMALVHAHGSGILHCDLKPANILLDKNMQARLADFGQSRLSHEHHHALGTLFFMAPEQADVNAVPDARWDVYAWGAVLYEALTGSPPYRTPEAQRQLAATEVAEQRLDVYRQLLQQSPRPREHLKVHGVDRRLAEIVDRCLQLDPNQRYANAQAVLDALDSRTRELANKPLIKLGVLAPIALLLAMGIIAKYAMSSAVRSAQSNLLDRALESDVVTVKILARSIEREFEDRTNELSKVAADSRLADAMLAEGKLPWEQRTKLKKVVGDWKALVDDARSRQRLDPDTSWFVTDAAGKQIYRDPYDAKTVDHYYRFRDYFHGRRINYDRNAIPDDVGPIQEPYVSMAYRSESANAYRVAITVPVRAPGSDRVIGVLGRSMALEQLLAAYKPQIEAAGGHFQVERTIALVDHVTTDPHPMSAFELLDHPWLTEDRPLSDEAKKALQVEPELAGQLSRLVERVEQSPKGQIVDAGDLDRTLNYRDPIGKLDQDRYGGTWLAAFWPVGHTDWVAVVQERHSTAQHPVVEMENRLFQYMRLGLVVCCALIAALWYFLFHHLNDRKRTEV